MASQVKATGSDRCRGMSAEDEMMFKLGRPFEDDVSKGTTTPKSTPPSSPDKSPEKEVLRPISMPKPFAI